MNALDDLIDSVADVMEEAGSKLLFPRECPFVRKLVHTIVLAPRLEFAFIEVKSMCTIGVYLQYGVRWNDHTKGFVEALYFILNTARNMKRH